MKKKPLRRSGSGPRPAGGEYRFKIAAYTPDTIPMSRLAQYLVELAGILGEPASVHFERLEGGSTVPVVRVEREAEPKVRDRILSVERGDAPDDAAIAFRRINKLLRDDNATGALHEGTRKANLLFFPGCEERREASLVVRDHGTLAGVVVRIGGKDQTVHVHLEAEGAAYTKLECTRALGKQIAACLFEFVRVAGRGTWSRDSDGNWALDRFVIQSFERLDDAPLSEALEGVRALKLDWGPDAYGALRLLRADQEAK